MVNFMSYDTERYRFEKLSNQTIAVIECGLQICHSGHSSGKLVYPDYSAHFIIEGKGTYTVNGKTYELEAGQGFMITPNIPNIYIADDKEPWRYIYATFKGPDSQALVRHAGLSDEDVIFSFPLESDMLQALKSMHSAGKDLSAKGYDALGYFLVAMSYLVKDNSKRNPSHISPERYVKTAISYINDHSSHDISVKDIAAFLGLDRTHLYRLFVRETGMSPSKYLTETRLKRAVSLMENPQLSIDEIANSSGFYDLSHFTKVFSAKYGMSPGKYRKLI